MNARPLLVLAVAALASTATQAARPYDPNRDARITESTDSARIAEIERHADELRARTQLNDDQAGASGTSTARERAGNRRARADRG
jgi:hypothetical protein